MHRAPRDDTDGKHRRTRPDNASTESESSDYDDDTVSSTDSAEYVVPVPERNMKKFETTFSTMMLQPEFSDEPPIYYDQYNRPYYPYTDTEAYDYWDGQYATQDFQHPMTYRP